MDRPQICRRAAQGTVLDSGFCIRNGIRGRSVFMLKNKRSVNNAEIWCFYIFHRFALKYGKGYTMLRWSASQFFIASRQNVEKCIQCWDQPLPNLSLGRARDIGKIIVFQRKRIDFRITGILENLLFSAKNKQTIFRTKTNGKLHQICTKSLKMWHFKRLWECFFLIVVVVVDVVVDVVVAVVNVVSVVNWCWWFGVGVFGGAAADGDEERERSGKQEQQKERREQKSKAGPYTLPNSRSPASGGNYHVNII